MNAFIDNYRREPMFSDSLEEFDDSREVVLNVCQEYKAAEKPDYVTHGMEQAGMDREQAATPAEEPS